MALAPTLYDFQLSISDAERGVDQPKLQLKIPRHPSETLERLFLRVLAFGRWWDERLALGPGLGDPDAPDLVGTDLTSRVTRWVRVGKAEPAKIQRAIDQNPGAQISVLFESPERMEAFLAESRPGRLSKAELVAVDPAFLRELAGRDARRYRLVLTFVEDHLYAELDGRAVDAAFTRQAVKVS